MRTLNSRLTAEDLDRLLPVAGPWRDAAPLPTPTGSLQSTVRVTGKWRPGLQDAGAELGPGVPVNARVPYHPAGASTVERGVAVAIVARNRKSIEDRYEAAPRRRVKSERFKPGGIPRGVDQSITLPHNCENHIDMPDPTAIRITRKEALLQHPAAVEFDRKHPGVIDEVFEDEYLPEPTAEELDEFGFHIEEG